MPVTLGGMSSGLPPNLVDQLIDAERGPIQNLQIRKEKTETKLNLVNDLETKLRGIEGSLGTLASVKGFNDIKLESGDINVVQGVADINAPKGNWNIEVVKLAQKASVVTNGFPDKDKTQVGTGYFRFETADGEKEVFINSTNNTLQGVAETINSANVGVKASVLNDRKDADEPYKLMISGDNVGGENTVSFPTLYFLDGDQDLYFDQENAADNGIVKIDGFEFEIAANSVQDIIPGVTLDLKQATPGKVVNISVKENREAVSTKVNDFVKAMNDVLSFIQVQSRVGEKTDTTKTLGGEQIIRAVQTRLQRLIQDPQVGVQSKITRLNQMGIEITREGVLKLDEDKFNKTLAGQPEDVQKFFAGDGFNIGFIPSVKREIATLTNVAFGPVAMKKKGLQDNISRLDQNIESKERLLQKREEQLRRKFAGLEETMSRLKSQGQALNATAFQAPSFGGVQVK